MRTANENREYKPSEFYPVTSLKTIRTGILDFLFSTVVQNKFLKMGPKETDVDIAASFENRFGSNKKLHVKHVQIVNCTLLLTQ